LGERASELLAPARSRSLALALTKILHSGQNFSCRLKKFKRQNLFLVVTVFVVVVVDVEVVVVVVVVVSVVVATVVEVVLNSRKISFVF
jgi:hypothetical protein